MTGKGEGEGNTWKPGDVMQPLEMMRKLGSSKHPGSLECVLI